MAANASAAIRRPAVVALLVAMALAATVALSACGTSATKAVDTVESGRLTAALCLLGPPMEYEPHNTATPTGFEVDLVKAMAKRMELEPSFKVYPSLDELFRAVEAGEADIAASPEPIYDPEDTEAAYKTIVLSDPYLPFTGSVVTMPGEDDSLAAVEEPGTRISVQTGTVDENWARQHFPEADLDLCDTASDCVTALVTSDVRYAIMDLPTALFMINNVFPNLQVIQTVDTTYEYRFGTSDSNKGLGNAVNDVLTNLKDDGYISSLQVKWFGEELGFAD